MDYQNQIDKSLVQTKAEQTERNFSQLSQRFFRSEQYFFKAGITVKPVDLSNLYDCINAKN